jgi:enamine deaminase RidA (YjgF/YER057c/UK114 family)
MNLVGEGDVAAQARQALLNLKHALDAVDASPVDIVRLRTYVVDPDSETLGKVVGEIDKFYAGAAAAPNTFLAVAGLALPDFLIEIEATVALV